MKSFYPNPAGSNVLNRLLSFDRNRSRSQEQVSRSYPRRRNDLSALAMVCERRVAYTYGTDASNHIMTHHTRTREMRKRRGLVRNAAIRRADATGCGFRATGSSRGTFMGQDSHRTAKPGRRPHCGSLLIESRSGCYYNALSRSLSSIQRESPSCLYHVQCICEVLSFSGESQYGHPTT